MSSVEGMWAIEFGDAISGGVNSGIIILESGRVFGGDSLIAYLGSYIVEGGTLTATARTWSYNSTEPMVQNAFGRVGQLDTRTTFKGERVEDRIVGQIWEVDRPELRLGARLRWVAALP